MGPQRARDKEEAGTEFTGVHEKHIHASRSDSNPRMCKI